MARKQPVGYEVRRPITLWGKARNIGDRLTPQEVASIIRIESLIRAGRINPIYSETDRGNVTKSRTGRAVGLEAPKVVEKTEDKPKRGRPKKVAQEEK